MATSSLGAVWLQIRQRACWTLLVALLVIAVQEGAAGDVQAAGPDDKIPDIGSRRQLMIDGFLVDRLEGQARLRLHNPVRRGIAVVHDAPWLGNGCNYYTVF